MEKNLPVRSQIIYKEYVKGNESNISVKNELKLTYNKVPYNLSPLFEQLGEDLVKYDPYQILPILSLFIKSTMNGLIEENLIVNNDPLFKTLFTKEINDKYYEIINKIIELYNILNINEIINRKVINTKNKNANNVIESLLLHKYRQFDKGLT